MIAYPTLLKPIPAYSRRAKPIPVYFSIFQPFPKKNPMFGTRASNSKTSRCFGQEREFQINFFAALKRETHTIPLENIFEREFPLMPVPGK